MNKILALIVLVLAGFPSTLPQKPKITGGEDAKKNELPYQVQLQAEDWLFGQYDHHCGGSIINESYILTAAHCVYGAPKSIFIVIAGEHDISSPTNDGTEQSRSVAKIIVHEKYKKNRIGEGNDIALLKLSSPLELNYAVKPIALPEQGHLATGMALVSGWGLTNSKYPTISYPTILQKVFVPITTKEVCKNAWGDDDITEDMICAGDLKGGNDSCKADSGGPMVAFDNGTYLAGVVSWGAKVCGVAGKPGVYANVSHFVLWINQKMASGQVVF